MHARQGWPAVVLAIVIAACGGGGTGSPSPSSASSPASPSASPSGSASPTGSASPVATKTVRLALDWTPNTNHLGFFVAEAHGWYADAGVRLQILPYATTAPEAILTAHQAECGISFQDALTFAVAAGSPIVSVMAILQHTGQELVVLADSGITRPKQLDGKTYAGFGYPNEVPTVKAVIKADGGTGTFTSIVADTAAYEAVYGRKADFAIAFAAQEGVEATLRGIHLRSFKFTDYGFPDFYQVVLACDREWLQREPDLAKAFVAATVHGFEAAVADPADAADTLIEQNPGVFDANPALPRESAKFLVDGGYLVDAAGHVGTQTLDEWRGYSSFLFGQGLLTGKDGNPLTSPPDYAALFTNDYLPATG